MMTNIQINQIYEIIGDKTIHDLVNIFYDKIAVDELLRPMFPIDMNFGREFQYLFLKQVFGGPSEYQERRGHPMLRKRHMPFRIGWEERNRWIELMFLSLDEVGITNDMEIRPVLEKYFNSMATKIINDDGSDKFKFRL